MNGPSYFCRVNGSVTGKSIWRRAEDAHFWNSSLKTRKKIVREKIYPNKNSVGDMESVDLNLDHLLLSLKDFLTQLSISKGSIMQQVRPKTVVTTLQIRLELFLLIVYASVLFMPVID